MMARATIGRPDASEYASFFARYVNAVPQGDILTVMRETGDALVSALAAEPESRGGFRYAEGKWTIREVAGHLIDAERIFAYRALRMARGDTTPLPGFDENAYALAAGSDARTMADLVDELRIVRESSVRLFASLPGDAWLRRGIASNAEISVRALAHVVVGHGEHHRGVLRERYGVATPA
jgi:uncharacterized damage-inducible protein DinB